MSSLIFPSLPGLKWDISRTPEFSTKMQTAASGKETTAAFWTYPKWTYSLSYELLRADATAELQAIIGLFLNMKGQWDTFLYSDPSDNTVAGQSIGTGNGTATTFQLCRTLGGFSEPMKNINGTPVIKINGTTQGSGWTMNSTGLITFSSPPANGTAITANFAWYFRCRFTKDQLEFNQFMKDLWEAKTVEFRTVKQ